MRCIGGSSSTRTIRRNFLLAGALSTAIIPPATFAFFNRFGLKTLFLQPQQQQQISSSTSSFSGVVTAASAADAAEQQHRSQEQTCAPFSSSSMTTTRSCSDSESSPLGRYPIGLGTLMMDNRESIASILRHAVVDIGYRRIDCAPVYFNEDAIGDAIYDILNNNNQEDGTTASGTIKRSDLFLVSKLAGPFHKYNDVKPALLKTLHDLRTSYIDLYLMHWPIAFKSLQNKEDMPQNNMNRRGYPNEMIDESNNGQFIDLDVSIHETWSAMEQLVHDGLVKYIGVSNFPVILLHELLSKAKIKPIVNQCERHLYLQQNNLVRYCILRNIHFQAYSPLGTSDYKEDNEPIILEDPIVISMATKYNVTPAQLCILWSLQSLPALPPLPNNINNSNNMISIVVKSSSKKHLRENYDTLQMMTTTTTATTSSASSSSSNNNNDNKNGVVAVVISKDDMNVLSKLGQRNHRYFRPQDWWEDMPVAVFD